MFADPRLHTSPSTSYASNQIYPSFGQNGFNDPGEAFPSLLRTKLKPTGLRQNSCYLKNGYVATRATSCKSGSSPGEKALTKSVSTTPNRNGTYKLAWTVLYPYQNYFQAVQQIQRFIRFKCQQPPTVRKRRRPRPTGSFTFTTGQITTTSDSSSYSATLTKRYFV